MNTKNVISRRGFLAGSAAAGAAVAHPLSIARGAHAAGGGEELKVALIGCGGRGTGAAVQALSTSGPVKLWAMADAFPDRLELSLKAITKGQSGRYDTQEHAGYAEKVAVPSERQFVGMDAYRKAIDCGVDVVILAEPPGLRPIHLEYAVKAGKHVFTEKPLASDAPGIRRVLAAAAEAKKRNLKIGVGLQRHHQQSYLETIGRLQDGAIGAIRYLRCYWDGGPPAKTPFPRDGITEMEYQLRNWYFFAWLSGDHIVEQHIHNIDVCNWVMNGHPVDAQGRGGRQVRTGKEYGHIYDHHAVEFTYADGTKMFSFCRQIPGCFNSVSEFAVGVRGQADISGGRIEAQGAEPWQSQNMVRRRRGKVMGANPYQVEHDVLFDAIRNNKPHNELESSAHSTMTAILGRLASYSGRLVTWDEAIRSERSLLPENPETMTFDTKPTILPDADGRYPVAMPGVTQVL